MARPAVSVMLAAQNASARMADRQTPFVFDDWYVAAFADELGPQLLARTLLGRGVVMYRDPEGRVVAMEDRCPHRSMPLSAGQLQDGQIVCAYHGMRFNAEGDCVHVPSQATCPRSMGVRTYVTLERGPVVWIWMGENETADPQRLPDQDWLTSGDWETSKGYLSLKASYVRLHENLLDLTHLSFLHARSFGTPDYASAAYETEMGEGHFVVRRNVVPTTLPPVWAEPTGIKGQGQAARIVRSEFRAPGMHEQLFVAFQEDVDGLALQETVLARTPPQELYEFSVGADGPSVAMRRYLLARANAQGGTDASRRVL